MYILRKLVRLYRIYVTRTEILEKLWFYGEWERVIENTKLFVNKSNIVRLEYT